MGWGRGGLDWLVRGGGAARACKRRLRAGGWWPSSLAAAAAISRGGPRAAPLPHNLHPNPRARREARGQHFIGKYGPNDDDDDEEDGYSDDDDYYESADEEDEEWSEDEDAYGPFAYGDMNYAAFMRM
jgi:hypothetical protein